MSTLLRPGTVAPAGAPPDGRTRGVPPDLWIVAGITALAAMLRFWTITAQSFWVDEATTVHEVGLSLGAMLHAIHVAETTPPLYFLLGWGWTKVFGAGELGIRSLSAVAGVALVPVVYLCGRELVSRAAGIAAATFAAVSPFLIWYSQEARSYMLFGLLSGLSVLFWARALRLRTARELVLWALVSGLALLTHFFAGFLVAPEGLWLLWRLRSRASVAACAAVAAVQLAILPLAISDTSHPLGWIQGFPLSVRLQQIPVDLGLSQLYKGSGVSYGLVGAAVLAALVIGLLVFGGGPRERRGAAVAGALAAAVLLVPIALAEVGHDYVVPRNFMPAWVPLAVVVAAAATVPRARPAGIALGAVLVGASIWAGLQIGSTPSYERPDWRGVAAALGTSTQARAIVAYDGSFAAQPLAIYLPRVPFSYSGAPSGAGGVTIGELDVVGNTDQSVPARLPAGVRRISGTDVGGYLVERFALSAPKRLSTAAIAASAPALLGPATAGTAAVLVQSGTPVPAAKP
jgi:4-amino-4-deoxy-L-arabinose transferase-like glycosyltransferase